MTANDRLFDELLRPLVNDYYESAQALRAADEAPSGPRMALLARMSCLEEYGARVALVLEVAEPLWDDMRGFAGLQW